LCPPIKKINEQGIQAHGGDLFQHSQWCALYLTAWYNAVNTKYKKLHALLVDVVHSALFYDIISDREDIKLEFIQLCGFMHDICKGGDNIFDMYEKNKYGNHLSDADHPKVCKKTLVNPKNRYKGILKKTLDGILKNYKNKKKALAILALCSAVHWNFGKLNIPPEHGGWTTQQYLQSVKAEQTMLEAQLKIKIEDPKNILIKLCMAIGCADVAASYNDELRQVNPALINNIKIADKTHLSSGASWINHKFNVKHEKYIKNVLKYTKKRRSFH
jgi:hypothetical protein